MTMYSKPSNPIRFAKVGETVDIDPTLAMTPSQMDELLRKGVPISTANYAANYLQGLPPDKLTWDYPIDQRRGVDMAEVWDAQQTARKNAKKASKLVTRFGKVEPVQSNT